MKHKLSWLLAVALSVIPLSANAHEELVDQLPAEGETVQAGVQELRLTFTNDLLELAGGAGNEIVITAPDQSVFYAGCLPTQGPDGILPVDVDETGEYRVVWRVVSADGHPISDSFAFFVENATGYESDPAFAYPDCQGEVELTFQEDAPQSLYWLLWASMALVGALLVFLLRPKKRPQAGD